MIPLAVIRAQPGCDSSVARARGLGLDARAFALFAMQPCAWQVPDAGQFDAVLAGSANAFRHGGESLVRLRQLPVLAVGPATAQAARASGFAVGATGQGGLQLLLDQLPPGMTRLLRLCGCERVALAPPVGVTVDERVVYAAEALPMPAALRDFLARPCVVALHSGEAAAHFAALCEARQVARGHVALAAIGPRVAQAAGTGWADVQAAGRPDDAALLALAAQMCQTRPHQA